MRSYWLTTAAVLLAAPLDAQSMRMNHDDMAAPKTATIMDGYGGGGFPVTTSNPKAQAFFDNGMQLDAAFAHKAAHEAMEEAVRLDPQCAMCRWGLAWVSGPTINFTKSEDEIADLAKTVAEAEKLAKDRGTDRERELIAALKMRYQNGGGNKPGDLAFAKAMTALAGRYPTDKEIGTIAAAAWLMSGPATPKVKTQLQAGHADARKDPRPGSELYASHSFLHPRKRRAGQPSKAEAYADRLAVLAPNASHLVHMPSHTYYWVGRYDDAAKANMRAVEIGMANAKRLGLPLPDGIWSLPYHATQRDVRNRRRFDEREFEHRAEACPAISRSGCLARDKSPDPDDLCCVGLRSNGTVWSGGRTLALPEPKSGYVRSSWHYARGEVFAAQGYRGFGQKSRASKGSRGQLTGTMAFQAGRSRSSLAPS